MDKSDKSKGKGKDKSKKFIQFNHYTQERFLSFLEVNDLYNLSKSNKIFRNTVKEYRLFQKYIEVKVILNNKRF